MKKQKKHFYSFAYTCHFSHFIKQLGPGVHYSITYEKNIILQKVVFCFFLPFDSYALNNVMT